MTTTLPEPTVAQATPTDLELAARLDLSSADLAAGADLALGSGAATARLLAMLDQLLCAGAPARLDPARGGWRVPAPTVAQLRLARHVLQVVDEPAELVAHTAAAVLPYELGVWPAGRADTGVGCAALYLAWRWRGDGDRDEPQPVADPLGGWPPIPTTAWAGAVAALASASDEAERVQYVAWRLGAGLGAVVCTDSAAHSGEITAALALFTAWRDRLARAEHRRGCAGRATFEDSRRRALQLLGDAVDELRAGHWHPAPNAQARRAVARAVAATGVAKTALHEATRAGWGEGR